MNKEEIIKEYVENVKLVHESKLDEMIGYPELKGDISLVASCAAVLTILNNLTEEVKKS